MSSQLEYWMPAARQVGVELNGPLKVGLPNGETLEAQLHVPLFGAKEGMLIFEELPSDGARNALIELGYGYSVFSRSSPGETMSRSYLLEVLRDWGWSGSSLEAPDWL